MNTICIVLFEKARFFLLTLIFLSSCSVWAQDDLTKAVKASTIETLNQLIIDNYVFPEVAQKTANHLNAQLKKGTFNDIEDWEAFGEALTKEVQSINHDKHMRIRPRPQFTAPSADPMRLVEEKISRDQFIRSDNFGFKSVKKLEGNVGYLELTGFASAQMAGPLADATMALLGMSDAIIIDLRNNGGGDPDMVQYLCSYFFKDRTHLNSLYWRDGDRTDEFWTHDEIEGPKLPNVPLFVLTSKRTFSAAEEFSYNMQSQKRATLVGETTGGGAHPGGIFPINEKVHVFIPVGRAINPITKTNWEGVGVIPEVKTTKEEALDKALALAKKAAEAYRDKNNARDKKLMTTLMKEVKMLKADASDLKVIEALKTCVENEVLNEMTINMLGYELLQGMNKPVGGLAILHGGTIIFPKSANTYDSYAEALLANGKRKLAIKNYEKAVKLGAENNDPNLDLYKENLQNAQQ